MWDLCTSFQPQVDMLQGVVGLLYLLPNLFGIATPPVATWFNPLLQLLFGCTVS